MLAPVDWPSRVDQDGDSLSTLSTVSCVQVDSKFGGLSTVTIPFVELMKMPAPPVQILYK